MLITTGDSTCHWQSEGGGGEAVDGRVSTSVLLLIFHTIRTKCPDSEVLIGQHKKVKGHACTEIMMFNLILVIKAN